MERIGRSIIFNPTTNYHYRKAACQVIIRLVIAWREFVFLQASLRIIYFRVELAQNISVILERRRMMGKTRTIHRSAVTGRFVRSGYAKQHTRTTVKERVPASKHRKTK